MLTRSESEVILTFLFCCKLLTSVSV